MTTTIPRGRRLAAALLTATAAATLAACGSSGTDAPAAAPAPATCQAQRIAAYPQVDPCSPEQVMTTAATRVFTYDPATQESQANSFQAAGPLLDPAYAAQVGDSAAVLSPITGATWARWKAAHDTITATATITSDEHPADTPTKVLRVVAVTQHVTGPNGKPADADINSTVYMAATRADAASPWLVSLIRPM